MTKPKPDIIAIRQSVRDLGDVRSAQDHRDWREEWRTATRSLRPTGNPEFDAVGILAEQMRGLLAVHPRTYAGRQRWKRDYVLTLDGLRTAGGDAASLLSTDPDAITWNYEEPGLHSAEGPNGTSGGVALSQDSDGATYHWVALDSDGSTIAEGQTPNHAQAKLHCAVAMRRKAK